jgi:hypothetical protein
MGNPVTASQWPSFAGLVKMYSHLAIADPPIADPPIADPPIADPPIADPTIAYSTIMGKCVAGGVLRLRLVRTTPSIIVMPTPGKLP